jgi:hypothetical protein
MEKLLSSVMFGTLLVCVWTPVHLRAQENCSLTVKLLDANGKEDLSPRRIRVTEQSGREIEVVSRRGEARFCDLGILPVTITVGSPYCHEVTVDSVPVDFGLNTVIKVVSDNNLCSDGRRESLPVPWCTFLLRFQDEQQRWVSGVSLTPALGGDKREIDPSVRNQPRQSDAFGRTLVQVNLDRRLRAQAIRDGYMPAAIELTCNGHNRTSEHVVTLQKGN